jgi:hypothetical protein
VWVGEGCDQTETLSVEISIKNLRIRCVAAYGPQEKDANVKKEEFWSMLNREVATAAKHETGLIIQMDGNLWAGNRLIPVDPNPQNNNGKLFENFLLRNQHLVCVNSLDVCDGVISRVRKTKKGTERAVLYFFIICDKNYHF